MKQHRAYTQAVILSTLFDKNGAESMKEANARFNDPFAYDHLYKHAKRHMEPRIHEWRRLHGLQEKTQAMTKKARAGEILKETMQVVDAPVISRSRHEEVLDLMIEKGYEDVKSGRIRLTAQTLNAALKTRADIENKQKDRKYDALKQIFGGAAPKGGNDGASPGN